MDIPPLVSLVGGDCPNVTGKDHKGGDDRCSPSMRGKSRVLHRRGGCYPPAGRVNGVSGRKPIGGMPPIFVCTGSVTPAGFNFFHGVEHGGCAELGLPCNIAEVGELFAFIADLIFVRQKIRPEEVVSLCHLFKVSQLRSVMTESNSVSASLTVRATSSVATMPAVSRDLWSVSCDCTSERSAKNLAPLETTVSMAVARAATFSMTQASLKSFCSLSPPTGASGITNCKLHWE